MEILNFFGAKKVANSDVVPEVENQPQGNHEVTMIPIKEEKKADEKNQFITIKWGTGMPIDIIYNFIHKNFEEEGFQDALVNSDVTYRDAKEKIIRNDLELLFKRITLRYKKDIRETDVNIDNARKAYALSAASKLQALRDTYEEHLAEINDMQSLLDNDDPKMLTMIESYRRGFLKGMSAVAVNFINNK